MAVLKQSWTTLSSELAVYYSAAQTFYASEDYELVQIDLKLARSATHDFTVDVYLYDVDVNHKPNNQLDYFGSIASNDLGTSLAWKTFNSGSYNVVNGTEYAILVSVNIVSGYLRWSNRNGYTGIGWTQEVDDVWVDYGVDWHFKTYTVDAPSKPINPTPTNGATDVDIDQATISWEDGGGATSYDVYYGENEAGLTLVSEGQTETSFTITGIEYGSPFDYEVSRTWMVNAINAGGTTEGDIWTFTTESYSVISAEPKDPRLWFSEVDDFENFEEDVKDADSFSLTIPATNEIRWIEALEALIVGTSGEEWKVGSNDFGTPITPTNYTIKQQSSYGSRNIQPAKVNEQILFIDFVGRKVRELTYSDSVQKFVSPDLTALAEHITLSGIVCIAHQRNPDSILWAVLDDGSLISMTYEREQDVVAWAKQPIDGRVQSVCVSPSANEDKITLSIARDETLTYEGAILTYEGETLTYEVVYIEKMMSRNFGTELEDAFFVDCGITYEGTATSTITGLSHLEGKTVKVLGNGVVFDDAVVSGGQITTKLAGVTTTVTKAQVGLPYIPVLEPMKPVINTEMGSSVASIVSVKEMGISFLDTAGAKCGTSLDDMQDIDFDDSRWTNTSEIEGLFTGTVVVSVDGGFSLDNPLIISSDSPLPLCVRALIPRLDISGR